MDARVKGLAALLRMALGAQWAQLHPDIRARFTLASDKCRQSFTGTMHEIHRSWFGWLIAHLLAFMRILPTVRARDVPFEFNLSPASSDSLAPASGWIKERLYRFRDGCFAFRSLMRVTADGELIEQFPYGLGMKIRLSAEGDALIFRDAGYFLCIRSFTLPIPRWLAVGRFTLTHQNIDREHFTVAISIDHPLFGQLFYQRGSFLESGVPQHRAETLIENHPENATLRAA